MNSELAWKATLGELELQMTKATFNTWLRDACLVSSEKDRYIVGVRNDYAKDWLESRLSDTIARTLSTIAGKPVDVSFIVRADEHINPPAPAPINGVIKKPSLQAPAESELSTNGQSYSSYTFATFIVGQSNRLAHAAALSVCEQPGKTYNPLFIYGGVGLGKTHLLHAISHRSRELGFNFRYVSSETFTNDLIQSIRSQDMASFREQYRTPDILLIDDIQFIAGKESTQKELFHTFNDLHSHGRQVVLSSDRPPKAMVTLEERLQSRFEWGLMADIQLPDVETRLAILRAKAESLGANVPNSVLNTIAHYVRKNIRELEGALNKVIAYSQLTGGEIDEQLASMALSDLMHRPEKLTIERVVEIVGGYYHVTIEALLGSGRSRMVAFPRQMIMYLARTETGLSYPQIGEHLGKRDHTTILYGFAKISGLLETDERVRRDALEIKAILYDSEMA